MVDLLKLKIFIQEKNINWCNIGEIPQQLLSLTFLAYLNLSHNQLTGPIPLGRQFATFENSSFEGNSRFCGFPLSKKCEKIETPTFERSQESSFGEGFS